jgi:hypothetical protein
MKHACDNRRSTINGVGKQVWIARQRQKSIPRARSQLRATGTDLGMLPDPLGGSEHGIEQPLRGNRIVPSNP